jgi:hypothetical protein
LRQRPASDPSTVLRRAGEDDEVPVGVAHPDLLLAGVGVGVHVALDGGARGTNLLHGGLEVGDLEPQQDTVAQRLIGIGETAVVVLDVGGVQLQQDLAVADDLLVLLAAVAALGAEYLLVEAAGRGDVADDQQRLWPGLGNDGASVGPRTVLSGRARAAAWRVARPRVSDAAAS